MALRVLATLMLLSLLGWCTSARMASNASGSVNAELSEMLMTAGWADGGRVDLERSARLAGATGLNRVFYDNAATGSLVALRWLIKHGAEPRHIGALDQGSLLQRAMARPTLERLKFYLEELKLDPRQEAPDHVGLIHLAARAGLDGPSLKYLQGSGLDVNGTDSAGRRPIHYAALKSIGPLVESGADVNARDDRQRTALHWAVEEERHDAVAELIRQGASVFAQDKQGNSPLHLAAIGNSEAIVDTLLAAGAAKAERNNDGLTPRELYQHRRGDRYRRNDREQKL